MKDFDANEDNVRLPGAGPGGPIEPAQAESRAHGAVALASPPVVGASGPSSSKASSSSRPSPGSRASTVGASSGASAPKRGAGTSHGGRLRLLLDYLDVVVVVVAAVSALALGAPAFGVLVGAGAWLLQRLLAVADRRAIVRAAEPGSRLGLNFIDAFARIWLLAAGIVVAGAAGSRRDGLAAALLILAGYSVAFAVRIARGREAGPA